MKTWVYLKRWTIFLFLCNVVARGVMEALICAGVLTVSDAGSIGRGITYALGPCFAAWYVLAFVDVLSRVRDGKRRVQWCAVTVLLTPLWYVGWTWYCELAKRGSSG